MDDYHSYIYLLNLKSILDINYLIVLIIVLINATLFAFGAAVQRLSIGELKNLDNEKWMKNINKIVKTPASFVNTLQLIIIVSIFIIAMIIKTKGIISYVVILFVYLVFSIMLPKKLGSIYYLKTSIVLQKYIAITIKILSPVIFIPNIIVKYILKICRLEDKDNDTNVTAEDIMYLVNKGHKSGVLKSIETQMITNIFDISDKLACDIMIHRKNIISICGDWTLEKTIDFMLGEGINTRYPVYKDNIDNILGIINMKDALSYARNEKNSNKKISNIDGLLRQVKFVPERRNICALFKEMQAHKWQMVVIVDEYGQTSGIVTMEDILEEIVGNIMDEYDKDDNYINKISSNTYILNGLVSLVELNEVIDLNLDEDTLDDFDTLNGYLISKLGKIPNDKEIFSLNIGKFIFDKPKVKNRVITRIRLTINDNKENIDQGE